MIRGLGAKIPQFKFNADDVTFNPYMAKRETAVFAASPIIQGQIADPDVIGDYITIPTGDQVSGLFYGNWDQSQGSIVFWITPEWDGNDGRIHNIIHQDGSRFYLQKTALDRLVVYIHAVLSHFVDVSGWTAGTTYCVVVRWDSKNTLDGTNYVSISVNNVHDFGDAITGVPFGVNNIRLGASITPNFDYQADAIIEGFTIYRRPLFDDTYGVAATFDASGPVDEIAAIWAAGAGADPCLTTGSWDVVFCLPTDATEGALVTGTGEAWSHPHSSNVLNHWTLEDAFYGGGQWAVAFNGTSTNINCGSAAVLDDLPAGGNILTVEAWIRSDTTGVNKTVAAKGNITSTGWHIWVSGTGQVICRVWLNGAVVVLGSSTFINDGKWHHVAMHYNDATKTGNLAIDGVWESAQAGAGIYVTDAASNLYIGRRSVAASYWWNGAIGWVRLSNNDRHTAGTDFIPPREFPGADGNTVEAWSLADGTGGTAAAQVTSPGNDGTITAGTWEQQWDDVLTPVYPTSLEFDGAATYVDCGSAAALDDLPAGGNILTVDGWVRQDGGSGNGIIGKGLYGTRGWLIRDYNFIVELATTDMVAVLPLPADGKWHHIVAYYNDTTKVGRCAVDGVWGASHTGAGAYQADAADNLEIGRRPGVGWYMEGATSWLRLSDNDRYGGAAGTTFVPPDRVNPPAPDGNTVEQWNLQDGAGTTATAVVTSPGNDGAITMGTGRWWNRPDMENTAPGSRIYQWGYDIGSDAANDGVHQHLAGLDAGENYVARIPVRYEADKRCQPVIEAYDETNGASISAFAGPWLTGTHDGGAAAASLSDSTAPYWPYSLVGGTVYNITDGSSATITAAGNSIVGGLAGGGSNDWNNGEVYFIVPPDEWAWVEPFCFELPTIARNGVGADCVEISFRLLNSAGEGVIYWQQVECLENLLDGPSMETGAGNPWIPDGWVNVGLDPGDSVASSAGGAVVHSGSDCIQMNAGALANERLRQTLTITNGRFYMMALWAYGDGANAMQLISPTGDLIQQIGVGGSVAYLSAAWGHLVQVMRGTSATGYYDAGGSADNPGYLDDGYFFDLDDVSLTVIPASEANSLETSGLRVDGTDTCIQTTYNGKALNVILGKSKWEIEFDVTPRHDAADVAKFGSPSPDIAWFYGDADDYIFVDYSAASILRLVFQANGGGEQSGTWNPATMNAGTTYTVKIKGAANSKMELYVDGVLRITISQPCAWGTTPATAYWGHHYAGGLSYDATYATP